jgi:hypothetical protein
MLRDATSLHVAVTSTIGRALKKTLFSPIARQHWVIPPKANSAFVTAMEDVLAVYTRPRDGDCPLVCLDETSKQLIAEMRVPIPMKAGRPARFDYEYERNGKRCVIPLVSMQFARAIEPRRPSPQSSRSSINLARNAASSTSGARGGPHNNNRLTRFDVSNPRCLTLRTP